MAVSTARGVTAPALLALLADGRVHSGAALARELGVSRAGIWKAMSRLRSLNVEVIAVARQGYRLSAAVELLEESRIRAAISAARAPRLRACSIPFEIDSTNSRLLAAAPPPCGVADVMSCEIQRAGRGRRGRQWFAPFGSGIALSMAWTFGDLSRVTSSLSLAVGVAVKRALSRVGASGVQLKWPNDLWSAGAKLGGILLELRAEASGPAHVVIGIGLNVFLTARSRAAIEASAQRVATVAEICATPPSRNFLAGAIIDELLSMLVTFERDGFEPFRSAWEAADALRDRPANVLMGDAVVTGIARGVDAQGALRLEVDGRIREIMSGEVSLRPAEGWV